MNFNGRLVDLDLEQTLARLGRCLRKPVKLDGQRHSRLKVLHIATELYSIGGHTRVLANWIANDSARQNFLLTTRRCPNLGSELRDFLQNNCEQAYFARKSSVVDRFLEACDFIESVHPDFIILHTHPDDIIVPMMLAGERTTRVFCYNHADHVFWLGASCVDGTIEFREASAEMSHNFRGIPHNFVIPFPLQAIKKIDRQAFRIGNGLRQDEHLLLTMASWHKLLPYKDWDFFKYADQILSAVPNSRLFVIGIDAKHSHYLSGCQNASRITLLGVQERPEYWCMSADYFVEPTPLATGLGGYDVLRHGAGAVRCQKDCSIYSEGLSGILPREMRSAVVGSGPPDSVELIQSIADSIASGAGRNLNPGFWASVTGKSYNSRLDILYDWADNIETHSFSIPQNLPLLETSEAETYADYCNHAWPINTALEMIASKFLERGKFSYYDMINRSPIGRVPGLKRLTTKLSRTRLGSWLLR